MKRIVKILVLMGVAVCLIAPPAFAAKFVAVNQTQTQGAAQMQFSTGGLSAQVNGGVSAQAYRLNAGRGSVATAGQLNGYGQLQARAGFGFNAQATVSGQNQNGSILSFP